MSPIALLFTIMSVIVMAIFHTQMMYIIDLFVLELSLYLSYENMYYLLRPEMLHYYGDKLSLPLKSVIALLYVIWPNIF